MDISDLHLDFKALGTSIGTTLAFLIPAAIAHPFIKNAPAWKKLRTAIMPLALAAGFLAGYACLFDFPKTTEDQPWYLDQVWMMVPLVALAAGIVLAIASPLPKIIAALLLIPLVVIVVLLCVRGPWFTNDEHPPWEEWKFFRNLLSTTLCAYLIAFWPAWRAGSHPKPDSKTARLWLASSLIMWASLAGMGVVTMAWVTHNLGVLYVSLAVLAGMTAVVGILPPLREIAAGAGPFFAILYAAMSTLSLRYYKANDPDGAMHNSVWILLACAPLPAALAWIPFFRRRPWLYTIAAVSITLILVAIALIIAKNTAPDPTQ